MSDLHRMGAISFWFTYIYDTSVKMFETACLSGGIPSTLPASTDALLNFINFGHFTKGLAFSSTVSYLSSLKMVHQTRSLDTSNFDSYLVQQVLKGLRNKIAMTFTGKSHRLAMTFPALQLLGDLINKKSNWSELDKYSAWTACLCAFWGSFRMGEIVSGRACTATFHTLRWDAISFPLGGSGVNIFIHSPKSSKDPRGQVSFLASHPDQRYCPVFSLKKLHTLSSSSSKSAVFILSSGKLVHLKLIQSLLDELTSLFPNVKGHFSCHSFRAALPTAMASHPDEFSMREISQTGKWASSAVEAYTRMANVEAEKSLRKVHSLPEFACSNPNMGNPNMWIGILDQAIIFLQSTRFCLYFFSII